MDRAFQRPRWVTGCSVLSQPVPPPSIPPLSALLLNLRPFFILFGAAGWTPGRPQISPCVTADVNQLPCARQSKPWAVLGAHQAPNWPVMLADTSCGSMHSSCTVARVGKSAWKPIGAMLRNPQAQEVDRLNGGVWSACCCQALSFPFSFHSFTCLKTHWQGC